MPWKLFYFLFIVFLFALFAAFNLHTSCSISFLFWKIENIPIYISMLFAFLIGCILTIPFFIENKKKLSKKYKHDDSMQGIQTVTLQNEKKSWFSKAKKEKHKMENNS